MTSCENDTQINDNPIIWEQTSSPSISPTRSDISITETEIGNVHEHSMAQNGEDKVSNEEGSSAGSSLTELKQLLEDLPSPKEVAHLTDRVALLSRRIRRNRGIYRHLQDPANRIEEKDEREDEKEDKESVEESLFSVNNPPRRENSRDARARRRARIQQERQSILKKTMVVPREDSTLNTANVKTWEENSDETMTSRKSSDGPTNDRSALKTTLCQSTAIECLNKDGVIEPDEVSENFDRSKISESAYFAANFSTHSSESQDSERWKEARKNTSADTGFNSYRNNLYREQPSRNDLRPVLPSSRVKVKKFGGYRPLSGIVLKNLSSEGESEITNTADETPKEKINRSIGNFPLSSPASRVSSENANLPVVSTRSEPVYRKEKLSPLTASPAKNVAGSSDIFVGELRSESSNTSRYNRFMTKGITENVGIDKTIGIKATNSTDNETEQQYKISPLSLKNKDNLENESDSFSSSSTENEDCEISSTPLRLFNESDDNKEGRHISTRETQTFEDNIHDQEKIYSDFDRITENVENVTMGIDQGENEIYDNTGRVKVPVLSLVSARSTGHSMTSSELSFKENPNDKAFTKSPFKNSLTKSRSRIPVKITDCENRNSPSTKNLMTFRKCANAINDKEFLRKGMAPEDSHISTQVYCLNCQENSGSQFWQGRKNPEALKKVFDSEDQAKTNSARSLDSENFMSLNYEWESESAGSNAEILNVQNSPQKSLNSYSEAPCVCNKDVNSYWTDNWIESGNFHGKNNLLCSTLTKAETEAMFCDCELNESLGKIDYDNQSSMQMGKCPINMSTSLRGRKAFTVSKFQEEQENFLHEQKTFKASGRESAKSLIIEDLDLITPYNVERAHNDYNNEILRDPELQKQFNESTNTTEVTDDEIDRSHLRIPKNSDNHIKPICAEGNIEKRSQMRHSSIKLLKKPEIDDGKHSPIMMSLSTATICARSEDSVENGQNNSKYSNRVSSFGSSIEDRNAYSRNRKGLQMEGAIGDCKIRKSCKKLRLPKSEKKSGMIPDPSKKLQRSSRSHKFFRGFRQSSRKKRAVRKKKSSNNAKNIGENERSTFEYFEKDLNAESAKPIASESTAYFMRRAQEFTVLPANFSSSTSKLADIVDTSKESSQIKKKSQERFPFTISETTSAMSSKFKLNFERRRGTKLKPQSELEEDEYRLYIHPSIMRIASKGLEETPYDIVTSCTNDQDEERPNTRHLLPRMKGFVRRFSNRLTFRPRKHLAETDSLDGTMKVIYKNTDCREDSPVDSCSEGSIPEEGTDFCVNNEPSQVSWLGKSSAEVRSSVILNGMALKKAKSREQISVDSTEPCKVINASTAWVEDLENDSTGPGKGTELWSRSQQDPETFAYLPKADNRYSLFLARSSRHTQTPECPQVIPFSTERNEAEDPKNLPTQRDCRGRNNLSWPIQVKDGKGRYARRPVVRAENDLNVEAGCFCLRICRLLARFSTGTVPKNHKSVRQAAQCSRAKRSRLPLWKRTR